MVLLSSMHILTEFMLLMEKVEMVCPAVPASRTGWKKNHGAEAGGKGWWEVRRCHALKCFIVIFSGQRGFHMWRKMNSISIGTCVTDMKNIQLHQSYCLDSQKNKPEKEIKPHLEEPYQAHDLYWDQTFRLI